MIGIATIWLAAAWLACSATVKLPDGMDKAGPSAIFGAASSTAALPPLPSRGCRLPPAERTHLEHPGETLERHLSSGGHQRRFLLALPDEMPRQNSAAAPRVAPRPMPLVLNLHGLMESPEDHQLFTGMQPLALSRGWAIAWPEGLGASWNADACCGRARQEQSDDVQFIRALVAQLGRELCLDLRRVYATGMSNGAFMSYRLACDASDLVAAVAPVAGVEIVKACAPKRPVPVLAINGTSDLLVPYTGRKSDDFPSVLETYGRWRERNQCQPGSADRKVWDNADATCMAATGCAPSGELIYCAIDGGGHTWPGGMIAPYLGKTSSHLDASLAILDFFQAHARP